jgi:hypothetical protein
MLRTGVKLLIVALVLHATYRLGTAYWQHYQFQDDVQQLVQFSERPTAEDVRQAVLSLADEQAIPLIPEDLDVRRESRRIIVRSTYTREVELLPRYWRPWAFDLDVTVLTLN